MVAGQWYNQDGLLLNYGTGKQIPEIGGDYLAYGTTRCAEMYIPLVPTQFGSGTPGTNPFTVPAIPTGAFVGTGTAIQAGIVSETLFFPLQSSPAPTGLTSGTIVLNQPQLFIESVEVETLIAATNGTSLQLGLVTTNQLPGTPNSTFVQVTPNQGQQLITTLAIASMGTVGERVTFTVPNTTGLRWDTATTATGSTSGQWLGNAPVPTNVITPLPQSAWLSAYATGTFNSGLIKVRVFYNMYGNISY